MIEVGYVTGARDEFDLHRLDVSTGRPGATASARTHSRAGPM
jgi:hypothetical protein